MDITNLNLYIESATTLFLSIAILTSLLVGIHSIVDEVNFNN